MSYKSASLYYWSGTGNTLKISRWAAAILKNRVSDVSTASMTNPDPCGPMRPGAYSLLPVLMPTHGFTAPRPVIRLCARRDEARGEIKSRMRCLKKGCELGEKIIIDLD
jgi:hypothetical protein